MQSQLWSFKVFGSNEGGELEEAHAWDERL